MLTLSEIANGFDPASGNLSLSVPLGSLPDVCGPGFGLMAGYSSQLGQAPTSANMIAPTGLLGLGWDLGLPVISAIADPNSLTAGRRYVLSQGQTVTELLPLQVDAGGVIEFGTVAAKFWVIRYDPSAESWTVIDEDGQQWIYGGSPLTLETAIAWGEWTGASSRVQGQTQRAIGWRLRRIVDLWKQTVNFTYEQTLGTVGSGDTGFTRAVRLRRVVGAEGGRIDLAYEDKTSNEYCPAHQSPPAPNAWQDRYDTKALSSVTVTSAGGAVLDRLELGYEFAGTGQLTKRLLTRLQPVPPAGPRPPGLVLSYQQAAGPDYGRLTAITTPLGGVAQISYTTCAPAFSNRTTPVAAPTDTSYGAPQLAFADNFTLAAWPASDQSKTAVSAFSWDGRWVAVSLGSLAISPAAPGIAMKTAGAAFAVQTQTEMRAWRSDPRMSGAWTASAKTVLSLGSPSATGLACIDRAAVALGLNTAKLQALNWTGSAWTAQPVQTLSGASLNPVCGIAGAAADIVAAVGDAVDPGAGIVIHRFTVDGLGQWDHITNTLPSPQAGLTGLAVDAGIGFAVITASRVQGSQNRVSYTIIDWSDPAAPFRIFPLAQLYLAAADEQPVPVIHGASIALGQLMARYDGRNWAIQSIEADAPAGAGALQAISFAPDHAVRLYTAQAGGLIADIVTCNPNTADQPVWSQTLSASAPAGAFTARAALTHAGSSRYALLPYTADGAPASSAANAIYYLAPDMSWAFASAIPDTLAAADLPSLQLVANRYVVYQSGAKVWAYPLKNGALDSTARTSLDGSLLIDGAAPDTLVGPTSFATYSGSWGASATLALHRATPSGADAAATAVVVEKIRRLPGNTTDPTTGYAVIDTVPAYETASAVMAYDGDSAVFNRVEVAEQSGSGTGSGLTRTELFNALTTAEAQSLPAAKRPDYPTNATVDPSGYTRLLSGLAYRRTLFWTDILGTACSDIFSWVVAVTERHFLSGGYDPVGFYSRLVQADSLADGVSSQLITTFGATGLPVTVSGAQFDADGQVQTFETDITYFPDVYTDNTPENLLSPIVRTIGKTNATAVQAQATTWSSDWGTDAADWAPLADFIAVDKDFLPFDAWTTGAVPQGWQRENLNLARNSQSGVRVQADELDRSSVNLYDNSQNRIVARFGVAAPNEVSYYGFEAYEASGPWSYQGSVSIRGHIDSSQYHTGSRSLKIAASAPASPQGPAAAFAGLGQRSYLFSCWILPDAGFTPNPATACFTLQAYTQGSSAAPAGDPVTLAFPPAAAGKWQYIQTVIDLPSVRVAADLPADTPLTVSVLGINAVAAGAAVHVDEMCFSPLDCQFSAVVFDPTNWLITAQLGENGATQRTVRNGACQTVSTIGPRDENIGPITALAYARTLSGAADAFNPVLPNQMLQVRSSSFGGYQDFDPSDAADWTLAPGWAIANRQLVFSGTSSDPIGSQAQLTGFSAGDYAARVRVIPATPGAGTVSIGTGDLFVSWTPDSGGSWLLRRSDGAGGWTTLASRAGLPGEDWLFAVVDNVLFLFVDGNQVFGDLLGAGTQGKLILAATQGCAFEELVIAKDPQLLMTFLDGEGQAIQSMSMVDKQTVHVTGILFDELGRPTIEREPVRQPVAVGSGNVALADRTQGALTTYLPEGSSGTQLTLAEYLDPAVSGAPFNQTLLEASPLARPIERAGPGIEHALGSGHTVRIAYGANPASGWLDQVLAAGAPGRAAGSYFLTAVTDPNGHVTQTVVNQRGQTIAEALIPFGTTTPTRIESYHYDLAGNLSETRLPNYYDPPPGAANGQAWVRTASHDFLGDVIATTGSNEGQTQFMYDTGRRLRFSMDAAGAALSPPQISYRLYDGLDREIERGVLAKAGTDWSSLAAHVDDPAWPAAADGAIWSRRFRYDRPEGATVQAPNQVGRLVVASFNRSNLASPAAAQIDTETYAYDVSGNVVSQNTLAPGFDSATRQTSYAWDNLNRAIKLVFPRELDPVSGAPVGNPVDVTYFYDRLGRMAAIGEGADGTEVLDPDNPNPGPKARYARTEYDERGLEMTTVLGMNSGGPISRLFDYDATGRPLVIGGDYLTETLTYGTGGLGATTDWAGRIGSSTLTHTRHVGAPDELASGTIGTPRTWQYGYHPAGWLSGALASDAAGDFALSAGTATDPITYDANGTLLTVPRPPAVEHYDYTDPVSGKRSADKIVRLATAVAQTIDLSGGALPQGWTLGASNAGPSLSHIVTGAAGAVADYVEIAGGTVGYHETLALTGAFGQGQSYVLAFQWQSADGFAAQPGAAGLYLVLNDASGQACRSELVSFAAGADAWTPVSQSIDLATISASLGIAPAEIVSVSLEFINAKCDASGQAGAALRIGDLVVSTAAAAPPALSYDASGRLTANPQRRLASLSYEPQSGRISALTLSAGAPVSSASYQYGLTDDLTLASATRSDGTVEKTLFIRAPGGGLLASYARLGDGAAQAVFEIPGAIQPLAQLPAGGTNPPRYYLRDHLGSVCAIAEEGDASTAGLKAMYEYGPFGELIAAEGVDSSQRRFTDQRLDAASGLTHFPARNYDPSLRAFGSADAAQETAWPYAYVGSDPVNHVDPSGNFMDAALGIFWADNTRRYVSYALLAAGVGNAAWNLLPHIYNNPVGAAADAAEWAVAQFIPAASVAVTSSWLLSPLLRAYANTVHWNNPHQRSWPIVSITMAVGAGMYSAASWSVVKHVSRAYIRGTEEPLGATEVLGNACAAAVDASGPALLGTLYQHFYAPRFMFYGVKGLKDGPKVRTMTAYGNRKYFMRADGFYAFEEYVEHISWVPSYLERGNVDMKSDTGWGLIFARPLDYFGLFGRGKMYYANPAYKATNLVLEHRGVFGYVLFLDHSHHTPGKGGPGHIGISTFIKKGLGGKYYAYCAALAALRPNALPGLSIAGNRTGADPSPQKP